MSVTGVNTSVNIATFSLEVAQEGSLDVLEKVAGMSGHLFALGKDVLLDNPYAVLGTGAAIGAGALIYHYFKTIPLPPVQPLVETGAQLITADRNVEAREHIRDFVDQVFQSRAFRQAMGPEGDNPQLKKFLISKIEAILNREELGAQSHVETINAVLVNFPAAIAEARLRVQDDIQEGHFACFGINPGRTIQEISPLGDETHNQGRIPLSITFDNGTVIVYKPRSMLPERLICDRHQGILREEGFGTYHVVSRNDDLGDYGYCEFLHNRMEENTVNTVENVREYVRKLCVLERLSQEFGITDLHYQNIITSNLTPHITDAEAFLNPGHIATGIFAENGASNTFNPVGRMDQKLQGKNRIWFTPNLTQGTGCNFEYGMSKEDLRKVGVDVDHVLETTVLQPATLNRIGEVRAQLENQQGRLILDDTLDFKAAQLRYDHRSPNTITHFVDNIQARVTAMPGFEFVEALIPEVRARAIEDIRNHDIPTFTYQNNHIYYHGIEIGRPV